MDIEIFHFGAYSLDPAGLRLLRHESTIPVPPKALGALIYLVERHGRLVGKDELLDAVWGHRFVSQGVLKNTITTLRHALNDDPKKPRYIETAHRLGYRFIAQVETGPPSALQVEAIATLPTDLPSSSHLVGRVGPLAELGRLLQKSIRGEPQLVFVSGEPGIGKTALIEAFTQSTANRMLTGHGQCVEQYGQSEPYLPVLEALNDLVRCDEIRLTSLLRQVAPTWLAQLPWYLNEADQPQLQQILMGGNQMRMLRELGEFLERCSEQKPVILVLEDLHWSDHATLDLLAYLARRKQPAHWLILGSYRPEDMMLTGHDLKHVLRELQIQGLCRELPLELLSEAAIEEYLGHHLPERMTVPAWAQAIHARTGGLPFFLVQLIETVQAEHRPERDGIEKMLDSALPEGVQQLLERQFERLPDDYRRMLEAASVVGMNFLAESVAAVLAANNAEVEECCESLARLKHFIYPATGSEATGRYAFRHAFYREFAYNRLPSLQSAQLHLKVGEWLETSRPRPEELATELALHFERGRDWEKAVKYLQLATDNAVARHALHEAAGLLRRGLALLERQLPETPERLRLAAELYASLVTTLQATQGYGASKLEPIHKRALELMRQSGNSERLFGLLWGIAIFYLVQTDFENAFRYARQLLCEAESIGSVPGQIGGHFVLGVAKMYGCELESALGHLEAAQSLYHTQEHLGLIRIFGHDPGASVETNLALLRWLMGFPQTADRLAQTALARAEALDHPYTEVIALMYSNWLAQYRRDLEKVLMLDQRLEQLANEHGIAMLPDYASVRTGWTLAVSGQPKKGIARIHKALADLEAADARIVKTYHLALLAEAQARDGQPVAGLDTLADALREIGCCGGQIYKAELYRLRGELLLQAGHSRHEAESCLSKAVSIAREQGAKSWELRAATSLARLWQSQGRKDEARELLNEIYAWFTEGLTTPDLRDAKALLDGIV